MNSGSFIIEQYISDPQYKGIIIQIFCFKGLAY